MNHDWPSLASINLSRMRMPFWWTRSPHQTTRNMFCSAKAIKHPQTWGVPIYEEVQSITASTAKHMCFLRAVGKIHRPSNWNIKRRSKQRGNSPRHHAAACVRETSFGGERPWHPSEWSECQGPRATPWGLSAPRVGTPASTGSTEEMDRQGRLHRAVHRGSPAHVRMLHKGLWGEAAIAGALQLNWRSLSKL